MKIYLVGNSSVEFDSIPVQLKKDLIKSFPDTVITEVDPTENFIPEEGSIIIDTVAGIKQVRWFDNIQDFSFTNSISPHDYDLLFHLQMLDKLHKLPQIKILGVPMNLPLKKVIFEVTIFLQNYLIN